MSSINSLRDAEIRINELTREVEALKKQIKKVDTSTESKSFTRPTASQSRAKNGATGISMASSTAQKEEEESKLDYLNSIDAQLSADGSTVFHRLKHVFKRIVADIGDTFQDVYDMLTTRILRIRDSNNFSDDGWKFEDLKGIFGEPNTRALFFSSPVGNIQILMDVKQNEAEGSIAIRAADIYPILSDTTDLGIASQRFRTLYVKDVQATTLNAPNITANELRLINGVIKINESGIDHLGIYAPNNTVINQIFVSTAVLQFKGWDNNNYSATVVTNVTYSYQNYVFKAGIRTA